MSDIFQEVDEEVRRDKAVEFWTKNQNLIFAAAVVIVLATGGYRYYEYRRLQASEAAGAAFQQALELDRDGKAEEARAALAKVAADAPGGMGGGGNRCKVAPLSGPSPCCVSGRSAPGPALHPIIEQP